MLTGILAGLGAGALWGLTFVAPSAVRPYSEIDLAVLRYGAFGLTSILLMLLVRRCRPGRLTPQRLLLAVWLGLSGFVIYYVCVAFSVSLSGPAIAPLVIGALPVLLALYGNWQERSVGQENGARGGVRWNSVILPLGLIVAGLLAVNLPAFAAASAPGDQRRVMLGLLLAVLGLAVWFLYAITNARVMRAADAPDPLAWTCLQGLGALAGSVPLAIAAPLMGWSNIPELGFAGQDGLRLIGWAVLTGIAASWIAQYLWTLASHRLPLALSAQLIVAETIFALLYGFLFQGRWPHAAEWVGGALLLAGVVLGVRIFSAPMQKGPA